MLRLPDLASQRGLSALLCFVLAALTAASLAAAVSTISAGSISWSLGPLTLRSQAPTRPLVVGALAASLLIAFGWRSAWTRWVGAIALVILALLAVLAQHPGTTWPVGDGALIELYTLHAMQGHQLLGAYSQYGWHHPGPLSFYWFAPFYALAGRTTFGLSTAVLFTNVASLAIIAWLVVRTHETRATFTVTLFALLAIYTARAPALLTSAWNPHTPMFPLIALLFTSAAIASGDTALLPLTLLLASFAIQTHVGFAVVAALLALMAVVTFCVRSWLRPDLRRSAPPRLMSAFLVMNALWLLPVAEQLVRTPGNMRLIARFFFAENPGQTLSVAWQAWGVTLASAFIPDFFLASGGPFRAPATTWPSIASSACVMALVPAAAWAWRCGRRFMGWLAIGCFLASVAGLYSALHVRGQIGDYHVFWLSLLGVVNVSVVIGEATAVPNSWMVERTNLWLVRTAACLTLVYVLGLGGVTLARPDERPGSGIERAEVRRLFNDLVRVLPTSGSHRPIVRLGEGLWSAGAGVILQMKRRDMPVSVTPENVWLFGESLAADGREDVLLTISRGGEHETLAKRPFNRTLAHSGRFFVDAVSLVDAPQYRP